MPRSKEEKAEYNRRYREKKKAERENAASADSEEEEVLSSEDAQAPLPPSEPDKKKVSGEVFLSQPMIVKIVAPGLGWVSAKAFGVENAMSRAEATQVVTGTLRIIGRHFFKNVPGELLAQTTGDAKDTVAIIEGFVNYVARRIEERRERKAEAMRQRASHTPAGQAAASPVPVLMDDIEEAVAMPSKPFNGTVMVPAFMGSAGEV